MERQHGPHRLRQRRETGQIRKTGQDNAATWAEMWLQASEERCDIVLPSSRRAHVQHVVHAQGDNHHVERFLQQLWQQIEDSDTDRLERMRHNARFLREHGHLRNGISLAEATDILWTCSSAELYELLVPQRGWSLPRFAGFVTDLMIGSLLPQPNHNP